MLTFCDPTDCYGPYCLERRFQRGRSLQGDAQQKQSQDLCISSCSVAHTISQVGEEFQSCTIDSCTTTLELVVWAHQDLELWPQCLSPVPVLPVPGTKTPGYTGLNACAGRDTEFPDPFLKDTIFHVRNAVIILKDSPPDLKGRHSVFRYLPKSYK